MNILVMNGSPRGEQSNTLKLTRAFLDGMKEQAEIVHTIQEEIRPCLGCYGCWNKTPGKCVQKDAMASILEKITQADLIIWSTPLYSYGVPSTCKAVIDRLLPLSCQEQYEGEQGKTQHKSRLTREIPMVLITGCGFPERENNYEGMLFQFERCFGANLPKIVCVEEPLLSVEEAKPIASQYLAYVKQAGEQYKQNGFIDEELQQKLDQPMIPPQVYREATKK
ncbi:flavodoxin family protein [Anaerosporobacter faecicola]|uniref:flavodoxin family protein n=1 Tax=Anaerosporobacter faecicola TaxID=2718714 RepID=UPI001439A3EE|nr:flavodoxin family protein [Anaerosporobacter faecicola]